MISFGNLSHTFGVRPRSGKTINLVVALFLMQFFDPG